VESLQERRQRHLAIFLQRRKKEKGMSIRQLARAANVNNSTVERFLKNGCADMVYKDAVRLLLLLDVSPTMAADKLGMVGILPQNKEEAVLVEAAWKLAQLSRDEQEAIIHIIDQRYDMLERKEVS
jgi:transcriptional regulator with XRE-family HTH domain